MMACRCTELCRATARVITAAVLKSGWEREARLQLQRLGPVYVKGGQLVASRADYASAALSEELGHLCEVNQLQDSSARLDQITAQIDKVCQDTFGQPFTEIFDGPIEFRHGASLADVYFGRTHKFGDVAVKVIRPHVREAIAKDKPLMQFASKLFGPRARMLVDEMFKTLSSECNMLEEMENMRTFRRCVQESKCKCPRAPTPYFGSESVMVMERMDCLELALSPKLMRCGLRTCITQLLLHGFLHADPHAGNLKVGPDGKLIFLDFGAVVRLHPHQCANLLHWMLAVLSNDEEEYEDASSKLGLPTTMLPLEYAHRAATFSDMLVAFEKTSKEKHGSNILFESEFATVLRPLVILEGRALAYDPNFKVLEACVPMILEVARDVPEMAALRKKALTNCLKMQLSRVNSSNKLSLQAKAEPMGFFSHAISTALPHVLEGLGHSSSSIMAFAGKVAARHGQALPGFPALEQPAFPPLPIVAQAAAMQTMSLFVMCYPGYYERSVDGDEGDCCDAGHTWLSDPLYIECVAELMAEDILDTLQDHNKLKSQCTHLGKEVQKNVSPLVALPFQLGYQVVANCFGKSK